jgi:hypothetical protein
MEIFHFLSMLGTFVRSSNEVKQNQATSFDLKHDQLATGVFDFGWSRREQS